MKICLISFDYWGFDRNIVDALKRRGIETTHIDLNHFKYSYPSIFAKVANGFSKLFFGKNIKRTKKQEFVLEQLEKIGYQDQILCIRPDLLDRETHEKIKLKTDRYVAYLYDSTKRFSVQNISDGIFDEMFSYDKEDSIRFNFKKISNYIYLPKQELNPKLEFKYPLFMVISKDDRLKTLDNIANQLDVLNIDYKFIVKSKRNLGNVNQKIERTAKDINSQSLKAFLENSKIMMDISRSTNTGLTFRVFESLAYQKKLITTNLAIKEYDFYNPNNILIVDSMNPEIPKAFFETPYQPLRDDIYEKYTIENWVKVVFGLN